MELLLFIEQKFLQLLRVVRELEVTVIHTDIDIVRKVKQGDAEAFGEFMGRYEAKLTRYLGRFLHDDDVVSSETRVRTVCGCC